MLQWITLGVIKRGLLLFWGLWFLVVSVTNTLDAMRGMGLLPASWSYVSGNWGWINQTMDPLAIPTAVQAFLFAGVIVWEWVCAVLFLRATILFKNRALLHEPPALVACAVALALWCAFQVLDEVFLAYSPEAVHRVIFIEVLLTMLFLQLMPADE